MSTMNTMNTVNRLVLSILIVQCAGVGAAVAKVAEPPPEVPPTTDPPASPAKLPAEPPATVGATTASLQAHRLVGELHLDGRLDELAWQEAGPAGAFTQQSPSYGKAPTSPTEVRVLYDDQYLYVGARMHHPPSTGRVTALVHRRDRDSASDWFGVAIDSLHDRRTAHEFRVNAAGVQRDVLMYADTNTDDTWDALWDSSVSTDADGWTAELRIPMSLLRVQSSEGEQSWGVNFVRVDQEPQETDRWHVTARSENAFVSSFPALVGLSGLRPRRRLEIIPYATVDNKVATSQQFDDRGFNERVGVDAHIGLGSSSLLDLSALPDFGQTEVDQVILNLSTIETFLPEKRTFFLEGSELFRVNGPQLFYSRRIGETAPSPTLAPGETLVSRPLALDILGAAKFTGKYDNGLNVGLLAAETESASAHVRAADGSISSRQVAPTADSAVARVLEQIGSHGSYLGAFSSMYVARGDGGGRRAYVGALDGTWKSNDGSMQADGLAAASVLNDDNGTGGYGTARGIKRWDTGWYVSSNATYAGRTFNPDDLGYLDRADQHSLRVETGSQWDRAIGAFRNWNFYTSGTYAADQAGRAFTKTVDGRFSTGFTNDWSAYIGGGNNLPYYDDRELRTFLDPVKKYLHHGNEPYLTGGFSNSHNSPWNAALDLSVGAYVGGPSAEATLTQTIHPSSRLELQLITDLLDAEGEQHWLETQGDMPIVGLRKLRQFSQIVRTSYAFTPNLTVQLYTQLLLASWNYRDLASYVDDNTLAPGAMSPTTNFTENDLNVNGVVRWEIRPGSTLYAVYTHGAINNDIFHHDASLSRQAIPGLLHGPSDDVFQLKLSWMFR